MMAPDDFRDDGGAAGVRLKPQSLKRYLALYEAALEDAGGGESPRARIQAHVLELRQAVMSGEARAPVAS
jgi:hypothetical protein